MRAHRLTGRNVIMEFPFSLVQVDRFHADRKNVMWFSYERVENFQVKMSNWKLDIFGTRFYLRIITLLEMAFRNGLCKLPMPMDIT